MHHRATFLYGSAQNERIEGLACQVAVQIIVGIMAEQSQGRRQTFTKRSRMSRSFRVSEGCFKDSLMCSYQQKDHGGMASVVGVKYLDCR